MGIVQPMNLALRSQEIDRIQQAEQTKVAALQELVRTLTDRVAALEARLE